MDTLTIVCPHCFKSNRIPKQATYTKANCGHCKQSLLGTTPIELTKTNFGSFFQNCTNLSLVHKELFKYNPTAVNFEYCFSGCTAISSNIDANLDKFFSSSLPSSGCNVNHMFYNCSSSGGNATDFVNLFNKFKNSRRFFC